MNPREAIAGDGTTPSSREARSEAGWFRLGYRRSLDGFRGVAILLVVLQHGGILRNTFGFLGVNIFFVLSGFLITSLLLEEWDGTGRISIRNFYYRRALRLLPALIVLVAVLLVYGMIFNPPGETFRDVPEALRTLFYWSNWAIAFEHGRVDLLGHTWSLSVEEQFYLVWPLVLVQLARRTSHASLFNFVALGAILFWLLRCLLYAGTITWQRRMYYDRIHGRMRCWPDARRRSSFRPACCGTLR